MTNKRILLAEDEIVIQRLCQRILAGAGHQVTLCDGVQKALAALREPVRYDLLITDLRMPDGHGVEIIREYRKGRNDAPVIIITGSPMGQEYMAQIDGMGPHGFIHKPFDTDVLLSTVEKALL